MNPERERERIEEFLKDFMDFIGFKGAVVGISGGVDSAVVAGLLSETAPGRVLGLIMPERDSDPKSVEDAKRVCERFKIECIVRSITSILRKMGVYSLQPPAALLSYSIKMRYALKKWKEMGGSAVYERDISLDGPAEFLKGVAYYRSKHRIRKCILYFEAEKRGYAVVGTTNKTEYKTGFYVKWGDDSVDVEPILHLYKTEVYELADHLGVPDSIISKPPSPDLIPGITDELALGMSYDELDRILKKLETGSDLSDEDPSKVDKVKRLIKRALVRGIKSIDIDSWDEVKKKISNPNIS